MDIKKRLIELIRVLGLSQSRFAASIKVTPSNISEWLSRPNKNPSSDALIRICDVHDVNLNWLLAGKGSMFANSNVPARARTDRFVQIPVVADIAAGNGIEAFDVEPEERITVHKSLLSVPGPYYAFSVSGESMAPYITTNDLAIVTQTWHDLDIQDRILAFRTHNGLTLKRFHIEKKRKLSLLIPLNPTYPILKYTEDDPEYTVLGLLLLIIRRF